MGAVSEHTIISGAVRSSLKGVEEKADYLIFHGSDNNEVSMKFNKSGNFIFKKGGMIWWQRFEEASNYRIKLFIEDYMIDVIELDRNKCYHTFTDLVPNDYKVVVEVENRSGNIIDSAEIYL